MAILLKCAACGAEVQFADDNPLTESVCLGCEVKVRRRPGDEEMAVPVSMDLPDQFRHVDLDQVSKHSDLLVERYRREPEKEVSPETEKDIMMAQALASLANAVARLEHRLDDKGDDEPADLEQDFHSVVYPKENGNRKRSEIREELNGNGHISDMVNPADSEPLSHDEVVQLSENMHGVKANPLEARLLVRREAAAEAHHYERKSQSAYDHRGREQIKLNWFSALMERHPVLTVFFTLVPTLALVGYVIFWMYDDFQHDVPREEEPTSLAKGQMSQRWEDDPAATMAEFVARHFLIAPSAKEARDMVYQYERISDKFEALYEPLKNPDDYELVPKGQQVMEDGSKVYAFRVFSKDEEPRTLVVLPEGSMPKVYWEFFAEVGDLSWEEFMTQRPETGVVLRAFVQLGTHYTGLYKPEEWQSYLLHDRNQKYVLHAYARRNSGADWNLNNMLKNDPVKFERFSAVRAQVEVIFRAELDQAEGGRIYIAEIKDVPSTSWLPARFVIEETGE